jgi:large subunit ribosomal protein L24
MKFRIGDQVLVTAGKDKGKKGAIVKVLPKAEKVVVEGLNVYVKHIKPQGERAGEKTRRERPLHTASVAIINDKGQVDRIGWSVAKDGSKQRIFKKTGKHTIKTPSDQLFTKRWVKSVFWQFLELPKSSSILV